MSQAAFAGRGLDGFYTTRMLILTENWCRHVDDVRTDDNPGENISGTFNGTRFLNIDRAESIWVANNIFTADVFYPIRFVYCRGVVHGGNLGPAFTQIAPKRANGADIDAVTQYPELYDEFDDAFILGF